MFYQMVARSSWYNLLEVDAFLVHNQTFVVEVAQNETRRNHGLIAE